jgi:hypothetical protein
MHYQIAKLIIALILMTYFCAGCQQPFDTSKAVATHRRFCNDYKNAAAKVLQKRRDNFENFQDRKRRRIAEIQPQEILGFDPGEGEDAIGMDLAGMSIFLLIQRKPNSRPTDEPATPVIPEYRASGLPARRHRLPKRFRDELPPAGIVPVPICDAIDFPEPESFNSPPPSAKKLIETLPDEFGVYRIYSDSLPTYTPDEFTNLNDLCNPNALRESGDCSEARPWWSPYASSLAWVTERPFFAPFLNATTFRLMNWFYSKSNLKSIGELDRLVHDVILAEDFNANDLRKFSAERESTLLDTQQNEASPMFSAKDGWTERSVPIHVPAEGAKKPEADAPIFQVDGLHYRNIVEVVKTAIREPQAQRYHMAPFYHFWKPSEDAPAERIYSEIYSSDAMIEEHERIRSEPRACTLETVVVPLMVWSDSTHLASFGNASLWPIYLFIGNLSKYIRGKPTSFAAHHIAYIPKVHAIVDI